MRSSYAGSATSDIRAKSTVSLLLVLIYRRSILNAASDLTEPVDIYSEWIDAADAAQKGDQVSRRPAASSSRPVAALPSEGSDDD